MANLPNLGTPLFEIRGLRVTYGAEGQGRPVIAVDGVDLAIHPGEVLGVLGESGSGKTTLGMALLRLLPSTAKQSGEIFLRGANLAELSENEMRNIRGAQISMIFQDPALSLTPLMRAGDQVVEVLLAHTQDTRKQCRDLVYKLLEELEVGDVDRIYRSYPHQLSGGQCQRVLIAQALACKPQLVIADEPTASLDAITTLEVLDLIRRIGEQNSAAFLLISHDPAVVSALAENVAVMCGGKIVEQGPADRLLNDPQDPYTQALLGARHRMPQLA